MGALDDNCKYFTGINPSSHMGVVFGTENALVENPAARNSVRVSVACEASAGPPWFIRCAAIVLTLIVHDGSSLREAMIIVHYLLCEYYGCSSRITIK